MTAAHVDWTDTIGTGRRLGEVSLWAGGAVLVLGVHMAAAAYLLNHTAPPPPGMPETYVIDIAPEMFAAPEDLVSDDSPMAMQAAPDLPQAPEEIEAEDMPDPVTDPIQQAEMTPPPDVTPPDTQPIMDEPPPPEPVEELPTVAEQAEVALPQVSSPPPPRPQRRQATTTRPPAPQTQAPPRVEAPRAQAAAAPRAAQGASNAQVEQKWRDRAYAVVARHMKRWRNTSRKPLTVMMTIQHDAGGRITAVSLRGSTGDSRLDQSLNAHAQRLPNLPPHPGGSGTVSVPLVLEGL